jgi:hypothetical protein
VILSPTTRLPLQGVWRLLFGVGAAAEKNIGSFVVVMAFTQKLSPWSCPRFHQTRGICNPLLMILLLLPYLFQQCLNYC